MNYTSRQFVHMIGIAAVLVLVIWATDHWYRERSHGPAANVHEYAWLASMNMREANHISKPLIRSGEVAMLLVKHSGHGVVHLKNNIGFAPDNKHQVIPLFHFDHNDNGLIDASDPLYRKLFVGYYHGTRLQVMSLGKAHVRAIVVHRDGDSIDYHAILSGGVKWLMKAAPQSQPYSPLLDN